ncbi:MAG: glycosyltransferase family 2 protein [Pseudomonadota bacterium]
MKSDSNVLVSVIVVNWNGQHYLEKCFNTLKDQEFLNFEIILADNASTDTSVEYTREHFSDIIIHQLLENRGYTGGNNEAARIARGKYLFFLNNDTKTDPKCLLELVKTAEADPSIGIAGCRELTYDGDSLISEGVSADIFGYPCNGTKLFYADGAALFIRRDVFQQLNGFDSKHFACFEDLDIGWRARLLGFRVICQPKALIYHKIGGTSSNEYGKKQYVTTSWRRQMSERNNLRNIIKNYALHTLIWVLPFYLVLNIMEMFFLCAIGNLDIAKSVYLNSWLYNLQNLPDTFKERKLIQQARRVGDWFILKKMEWKIGKLSSLRSVGIPKFVS